MTPDADRIAKPYEAFDTVEALLRRLHLALNARDLDAVVACYAPTARFVDNLDGGEVEGVEAVRGHFIRLFEAVRLDISLIDHALEPDGRVKARMHVVTRGLGGGLWQDGEITVRYRLEHGLIAEQDVDDHGRAP
jgi:ketosteroid isomerase-like protein